MEDNKNTFGRFSEKMDHPVPLNDTDWNIIDKKIGKAFFYKWRPTSFNIYYLSIILLSTSFLSYCIYSKINNKEVDISTSEINPFDITKLDNKTVLAQTPKSTENNTTSINEIVTAKKKHSSQIKNNIIDDKTVSLNTAPISNYNYDKKAKVDKKTPATTTPKKTTTDSYSNNNQETNSTSRSTLPSATARNVTTPSPNSNLSNKEKLEIDKANKSLKTAENISSNQVILSKDKIEDNISLVNKNNIDLAIDTLTTINNHIIDSTDISKIDTVQAAIDSTLHKPVVIHRRDTIFNYDSTKVPRYRKKKFGLK